MLGLGNSITGGAVIPAPVIGEIAPNRLKIWLKRGASIVSSSGVVDAWASTSPANVNFQQTRSGNRPALSGDEVTFDSSNDEGFNASGGANTYTQFTLMAVLNPDESATLSDEFIVGETDDDMIQIYTLSGTTKMRLTANSVVSNITLSSAFTTGDNDFLLTVTRDTSGNLAARINGTELGTGTSDINDGFDVGRVGSNVGAGGSNNYDGQINEVVLYDLQLTGSDLTNAENDVMNRSNISK